MWVSSHLFQVLVGVVQLIHPACFPKESGLSKILNPQAGCQRCCLPAGLLDVEHRLAIASRHGKVILMKNGAVTATIPLDVCRFNSQPSLALSIRILNQHPHPQFSSPFPSLSSSLPCWWLPVVDCIATEGVNRGCFIGCVPVISTRKFCSLAVCCKHYLWELPAARLHHGMFLRHIHSPESMVDRLCFAGTTTGRRQNPQ